MKPKVLILLSAYNGEAYLTEQAESILTQEGAFDLTLRIRDDGSQDKTPEVARALAGRFPGRVEYLRGENLGYNGSFFTLIDGAAGYDFYGLSDQDDKWLPGKVEAAVGALKEAEGPALYACPSYTTDAALKPVGQTRKKLRPITPANTLVQNICPGHNQFFNNELLTLIQKPRDVSRIYVYDLWIAGLAALYGRILFDQTPRTLYRQHGNNELGYGKNLVGKLVKDGRSAMQGKGSRNKIQMAYFAEENRPALETLDLYQPVQDFLTADSFGKRFRVLLYCPFYRQSRLESFLFRAAYLFGKY
ncbi:MAG: glycosyltransferase [Lachnospiraceae bacterium]|nr:glycosyltransferase [Lachnospiraceae bacterium]